MSERQCCICGKEPYVTPVRFPLLREAYLLGAECHAAWRVEAQSLGGDIFNPARVHIAFMRFSEGRAA